MTRFFSLVKRYIVVALLGLGVSLGVQSVSHAVDPTTPGPVSVIVDSVTDTTVSLSWDAPLSNGGSPITDYVIQYRVSDLQEWATWVDGVSLATSVTVTGLTRGIEYEFRVGAVNAAGNSISAMQATTLPLHQGVHHTCAVSVVQRVRCWGLDEFGQLGDGSSTDQVTPVTVSGLAVVTSVGLGSDHSCAVLADETVKCWGDNAFGQLGDDTTTNRRTPVVVSGLSGVRSLSLGGEVSCALLLDQTVKCWGINWYGQLGDGTEANRLTPVVVPELSGVSSISVGASHSCAVLFDQTVKCWGNNAYGQVGDGTTTNRLSPVVVPGLSGVSSISVGASHSCAVLFDQTVKCWGNNAYGQVGVSARWNQHSPVVVPGLSGVSSISVGEGHSCALLLDQTVKCWGDNAYGQLGDDTTTNRRTPVVVSGLSGVSSISVGAIFSCAVLLDQTVKCWGYNGYGQLGDGTTTNRLSPVVVSGLSGVSSISVGASHSCAVLFDQTVKCWGNNAAGQLGDGTSTNRLTPVIAPISHCENLCVIPSTIPGIPAISSPIVTSRSSIQLPISVADNGGIEVSEYQVQSRIVGETSWSSANAIRVVNGAIEVTGLIPGQVREFQVAAINARGQGGYSQATDGLLLAEVPTVPTAVSASPISGSELAITWELPLDDGGAPVTQFQLRFKTADGQEWSAIRDIPDSNRNATISALTQGSSYEVQIRAINGAGQGAWVSVTGVPSTVPGVPTNVTASVVSAHGLELSWNVVAADGGASVEEYLIQFRPSDSEIWSTPIHVSSSIRRYRFGSLISGKNYFYKVAAVNNRGIGEYSSVNSVLMTYDTSLPIKKLEYVARTKSSISIRWEAPTNPLGVTVTGYQIQVRTAGTNWVDKARVGATVRSSIVSNLVSGRNYQVRVLPTTARGRTELTNFPMVAAGYEFSCVLLDDALGTAKCWGDNSYGQLGNASYVNSSTPVSVKTMTGVKQIRAGYHHACALTFQGDVYCWGNNEFGQLGTGAQASKSNIPILVAGLADVVEITSGGFFNCALEASGNVKCWGDNEDKQISSTLQNSVINQPQSMNLTGQVTDVSAGVRHACAVLSDHKVECWGDNSQGQRGSNEIYPERWELPITWDTRYVYNALMGEVKSVEAGDSHTCAINMANEVWCWGLGDSGQLGGGQTSFNGYFNFSDAPMFISGGESAIAISGGQAHTCFVSSAKDAYCWGWNHFGQVGNPEEPQTGWSYSAFTDVTDLVGALDISAGAAHTCSSNLDGYVYCWGSNSKGQSGGPITTSMYDRAKKVDIASWNSLAVPAEIPSAPTGVILKSVGKNSTKLTFVVGAANGSPVTSTQYRKSTDNKSWSNWSNVNSGSTLTGWVKGKKYYVQIRSSNGVGAGIQVSLIFKPTQ